MNVRGSISPVVLAGALVRLRLRSFRNGLRARGRGRLPLLVAAVGLLISASYVGLFKQAFAVVAETADLTGQVAALALVAGALAFGSLSAKAASSEAARAGSPENEFLLARPVSLAALVTARGLADAITDPVGALFLLPVLISAAWVWRFPVMWLPVAVLTSMLVQVSISLLAYTTQVAIVRYVSPARRRVVWMALRLVAALALALLWMLGTWVLRAPAALAAGLSRLEPSLRFSPGALIAAPLAALIRGTAGGALTALAGLAALAAGALLLATAVARRAGLRGWEEAGATWAEATAVPRGGRAPTAATKDLRLIVRDRSQLLALVAMPAIFVGVQIFGAVGWTWSTASLSRVSCLAYSLAMYMATIGPLAHMQAERRAFWILRTVPVPLGTLMAAKARAWAIIVGGTAALTFAALSFAIGAVSAMDKLAAGLLVTGGAVATSFLAVGMACAGADLSEEQSTAVGPGTIYGFLLVGGLFNVLLTGQGAMVPGGLGLYLFAVWATWRSGIERAERCMDAEAVRTRRLRLSDGAAMLIVLAFGARGIVFAGATVPGSATIAAMLQLVLVVLIGAAAALYLARRPSLPARRKVIGSALVAAGIGIVLGVAGRHLGLGAGLGSSGPHGTAIAVLGCAVVILAEETLLRGIVQRGIAVDLAARALSPVRARWVATAASVALAGLVSLTWSGAAPAVLVATHAAAATTYALTGRTTACWLARAVGVAVAVAL